VTGVTCILGVTAIGFDVAALAEGDAAVCFRSWVGLPKIPAGRKKSAGGLAAESSKMEDGSGGKGVSVVDPASGVAMAVVSVLSGKVAAGSESNKGNSETKPGLVPEGDFTIRPEVGVTVTEGVVCSAGFAGCARCSRTDQTPLPQPDNSMLHTKQKTKQVRLLGGFCLFDIAAFYVFIWMGDAGCK
jgi:hypothetical protein